MSYHVAAEGSRPAEVKGRGKYPEVVHHVVPVGICHAVPEADNKTVCGISVHGLATLPDQRWGQGIGRDWCDDCAAIVPL